MVDKTDKAIQMPLRKPASQCPWDRYYKAQDAVLGHLPLAEAIDYAEHLDSCTSCQKIFGQAIEFWGAFRAAEKPIRGTRSDSQPELPGRVIQFGTDPRRIRKSEKT
jgi:hypothetical protein